MKVIEYLKMVKQIPQYNRNPSINDENLESLINQVDMLKEDEQHLPYPILGTRPQQYIPKGLLMTHKRYAWINHGQSLDQLAQRGGLSWTEALAIISGKLWKDVEHDENKAEIIVKKLVSEYIKG